MAANVIKAGEATLNSTAVEQFIRGNEVIYFKFMAMYYWYKLTSRISYKVSNLICDNDENEKEANRMRSVTSEIKRKWIILGLIESIPLLAGIIASTFHHFYFEGDFLLCGSVATLLFIYILKDKTPSPPLSLKSRV